MNTWRTSLKADPVPFLLSSDNATIAYFTQRDLLDEGEQPAETLWHMPEVENLLKRQLDNGRGSISEGSSAPWKTTTSSKPIVCWDTSSRSTA